MLNAFLGSALLSMLGILLGAPIGVLAGTYLAEYSSKSWLGETVRFVNDILLSAPSIVLGLFVYTMVVAQMGHFSALAGGIALAFIVLPVVVRTTDEMLRLVPSQMREAAQWSLNLRPLPSPSKPLVTLPLSLFRVTLVITSSS